MQLESHKLFILFYFILFHYRNLKFLLRIEVRNIFNVFIDLLKRFKRIFLFLKVCLKFKCPWFALHWHRSKQHVYSCYQIFVIKAHGPILVLLQINALIFLKLLEITFHFNSLDLHECWAQNAFRLSKIEKINIRPTEILSLYFTQAYIQDEMAISKDFLAFLGRTEFPSLS